MPRCSGTPLATARETSACAAWLTASEIVRLPRGDGPSRHLAFSPDGRYLIAGYAIRRELLFDLWDISHGEIPTKVIDRAADFLHFSPDGRRVASRLSETTIGLFDPATGEVSKTIHGRPRARASQFPPGRSAAHGPCLVARDPPADRYRERGEEVWSHTFEVDDGRGRLARRWAALRRRRRRSPDLCLGHGRRSAPVGPGRPSKQRGRPPVHPRGRSVALLILGR